MDNVMDFGTALAALKNGDRIARTGWNGKNMWLHLVPGSQFEVEAHRPIGRAEPSLIGQTVTYRPHIDMRTADGEFVPWIASQSDLLGDDWVFVH